MKRRRENLCLKESDLLVVLWGEMEQKSEIGGLSGVDRLSSGYWLSRTHTNKTEKEGYFWFWKEARIRSYDN